MLELIALVEGVRSLDLFTPLNESPGDSILNQLR